MKDDTQRNPSLLTTWEVDMLTDSFIRKFANGDHNAIEDLGGAAGDLDDISKSLAKKWAESKASQEQIQALTNGAFWQAMKQSAMCAYEHASFDY